MFKYFLNQFYTNDIIVINYNYFKISCYLNRMTKQLLKSIDIGPYSLKKYKNIKLTSYKESPQELEFLLNWLFNYVGNNIVNILEKRLYYLVNDDIIVDIQYYVDRLYNTVAYGRKTTKFGTNDDNCQPIIGEPVWICPTEEEDVHLYNDHKRKEYHKLEKKLNLYMSSIETEYKLPEKKEEENKVSTVINKNGFKIFKVNKDTLERANKNKPVDKLYKVVTNSGNKSNSLVIKNIPRHISRDAAYKTIRTMFLKFGGISKLTILNDKIDTSRLLGIGFIDFYNSSCVDKILNSNTKFIMDRSILLLERQKKKTK